MENPLSKKSGFRFEECQEKLEGISSQNYARRLPLGSIFLLFPQNSETLGDPSPSGLRS